MSNIVEDRGDFYISYVAKPDTSWDILSGLSSQAETAIVTKDRKFYILNGDWREEFKDKSFEECLTIWRNNPDKHSDYSNKEAVS